MRVYRSIVVCSLISVLSTGCSKSSSSSSNTPQVDPALKSQSLSPKTSNETEAGDSTAEIERNPFLEDLKKDRDYGKLNTYIIKEIGNLLSPDNLLQKIRVLNTLAKSAKMSNDKASELFEKSLKISTARGLSSANALEATIDGIALQIAMQKK